VRAAGEWRALLDIRESRTSGFWMWSAARNRGSRLGPARRRFPSGLRTGVGSFSVSRTRRIYGLYWKDASGAGPEELLLKTTKSVVPTDWSRDVRFILVAQQDLKLVWAMWVLPLTGDRKPVPGPQSRCVLPGVRSEAAAPGSRLLPRCREPSSRYHQENARTDQTKRSGGLPMQRNFD